MIGINGGKRNKIKRNKKEINKGRTVYMVERGES
jgi:hypothetical protein